MKISDVIRGRGTTDVVTGSADDTVSHLLSILAHHGIGALVVVDADGAPIGIVSERDVVRGLPERGTALLDEPVSSIMVTQVHTCTADDEISDVATLMTRHRVRHIPVVEEGRLVSIVSIGDVVKHRIEQLQGERDQLVDYIQQ